MENESFLPSEVNDDQSKKNTGSPKSWMPKKTVDVIEVAKSVVKSWKLSIFIISWVTWLILLEKTLRLEIVFLSKNTSKGKRTSSSNGMKELKDEGNFAAGQVKHYVQSDFSKDEALSKYAEFGFEHKNKNYKLPNDSIKRLQYLKMMQQAVIDYGYSDREFGSAFWEAHIAKHIELLDYSREGTKQTSVGIGEEEVLREEILTILSGVSHMLASESPKDFERLRRSWGFLREKN